MKSTDQDTACDACKDRDSSAACWICAMHGLRELAQNAGEP